MVIKQISSNLLPPSLWKLAVCLLEFSARFTVLYPFFDLFIHFVPEYMLSCLPQACFDPVVSRVDAVFNPQVHPLWDDRPFSSED